MTGSTERTSVDSAGHQADNGSYRPSISGDGRYVAFESDARNLVPGDANTRDIYVHDRETGVTELVSVDSAGVQAPDYCWDASISADGRYVAFASYGYLVADDTNRLRDVYVRDRVAGTTERVSVSSDGTQGDGTSYFPAISADGRYIAFESFASNLGTGVDNGVGQIYVHDRETGSTQRVTVKNLKVIDVRPDMNVVLVRGAVPGGTNSLVEIAKA